MPSPSERSPAAVPAIRLHNLTLGYDRHPAIHHLSLTIEPGSLVAIVGPNGAGKSTLIKALAGRLLPLGGRIDGIAGQRVAWLPQQSTLDRSFPMSVQGLVELGLWHETGALGRLSAAHRAAVAQALTWVGLGGMEKRSIDTLSGGQLQRALFARVIVQDASILLLDEPFAAVDQRTSDDLLALLHRWHREGRTVLTVLHDLQQVRRHFPLTLLLARDHAQWGATDAVLTEDRWQDALRLREPFDDHASPCLHHPSEISA
jgi:zinc/manganese transport system ATP-binding protein